MNLRLVRILNRIRFYGKRQNLTRINNKKMCSANLHTVIHKLEKINLITLTKIRRNVYSELTLKGEKVLILLRKAAERLAA